MKQGPFYFIQKVKGTCIPEEGHIYTYYKEWGALAPNAPHFCGPCYIFSNVFKKDVFNFFVKDVEILRLLKAKEGGENVQILSTCRILERKRQTIHEARPLDINCLQDIAGIRAALDVLSTYLGDQFVINLERFKDLPTCIEAARHLCNNQSQNVVQLFLLKQLVRHDSNGIDAVKERCKRNELKWIMPPQSEVGYIFTP